MWKWILCAVCVACLCTGQRGDAHQHHTYIVEETPIIVNETPYAMVESEPPADIEEQMEMSPGVGYVWTKGYWSWNGQWVWRKGCWVQRPHPGAVWVPGFWIKHHHHWSWTEGHWE